MHVVATAGHVDHGKSTLVRALTGMEPDRWAEERRRGMTIDLGFAWTALPTSEVLGFVDVPGHQRFLGNMLAGLGPAPAVLFVVAADQGWGRQSEEHLTAIDGLDLRHGLLAVTRSDLADPGPATQEATSRIAVSSLGAVPAVAVSGTTGDGLAELRLGLGRLVADLPRPQQDGPVRLWVDRVFTIRGAGTVVTGTLTSGALTVGDEVQLPRGSAVIRGLQTMGQAQHQVVATARVAVNLRGVDREDLSRGAALLTGSWQLTREVDVRVTSDDLPEQVVLHLGTAALPVRIRRLGDLAARLRLPHPLPLRAGDRGLLREPAGQRVLGGVVVLDVEPPALVRRGAAARRAADLVSAGDRPDLRTELARHGAVRVEELAARGIAEEPELTIDGWAVDPSTWQRWAALLAKAVDDHAAQRPLDPAVPDAVAVRATTVPIGLLPALVAAIGLVRSGGRIARPGALPDLGSAERAVSAVEQRLQDDPFDSPSSKELESFGLSAKHLAAAQRAGRVLVLGGHVLLPGVVELAVRKLMTCPQPFSVATGRQAMGARRPVAVAVLEHLDHVGHTRRLCGGVRLLNAPPEGACREV